MPDNGKWGGEVYLDAPLGDLNDSDWEDEMLVGEGDEDAPADLLKGATAMEQSETFVLAEWIDRMTFVCPLLPAGGSAS